MEYVWVCRFIVYDEADTAEVEKGKENEDDDG